MKTLIQTLIILILSLSFFGCGAKVPFKEQKPLDNSALVYVYATQNQDSGSYGRYFLQIDGVGIDVTLVENEYTYINLKAHKKVKVSATRSALITKNISLDTKANDIYYLRINTLQEGSFEFENVDEKTALKEIKNTTLHGEVLEETISALISDEPKEESSEVTDADSSKLEKIKEANKLKEDGIISQEEFEKLKADILK